MSDKDKRTSSSKGSPEPNSGSHTSPDTSFDASEAALPIPHTGAAVSASNTSTSSEKGQKTNPEKEKVFAEEFTAEDRLRQNEEIQKEINSRPLVGWKEPGPEFDSLYEELKSNHEFVRKLPYLGTKYSALRRIRGDGNCFYRGYFFRLVEELLNEYIANKNAFGPKFRKIKAKIDNSLNYLTEVGYVATAIDFFCDIAKGFFNVEESAAKNKANDMLEDDEEYLRFPRNQVQLEQIFADPSSSMYLIWFCKLLAAGYIKHHWEERFKYFVESDYLDADDFCAKEVEPTDRECGQIQIIAVCEYFETRICVEYLDGNFGKDQTAAYYFGPDNLIQGTENASTMSEDEREKDVKICLLYRPGHYDIIYKLDATSDAANNIKNKAKTKAK